MGLLTQNLSEWRLGVENRMEDVEEACRREDLLQSHLRNNHEAVTLTASDNSATTACTTAAATAREESNLEVDERVACFAPG